MKILFIGGVLDGRRTDFDAPPPDAYRAAVARKIAPENYIQGVRDPGFQDIEIQHYRLVYLGNFRNSFFVYVLSDPPLSRDDALERLIQFYRPTS